MGQQQQQVIKQPITFEQVDQSIKMIFDDQETKYMPQKIGLHTQRILQNLSDMIPAQKTQQGFILNPKMIEIFYHKGFMFSMGKLINLLIDRLEEIMQRSLIMIKKQEWSFCLNLANFIIFFTDDKLIRMIETVGIRSDLSHNTAKFIEKLQKDGKQFTATQSLIDKLAYNEVQRIEKCLRISLNQMISMRTQVITRSQHTLKVIQKLQQACFILYLKALYSPQHSQSILTKAKHTEFLKSNLTIAHYFLGKGSDLNLASIYQSAVLMLFNLIQKNKDLREFKSLPTHLFKTLPIVSQNTVYDFVMNICLYSSTYIKQGNNLYTRFSCNRLMTLKLVDLLVKQIKISSPQITYYLEQICLQTKIGMIQRSFVTDLVQNYVNLVKSTIELIQQQILLKKQKPSQSSSKIRPNQLQSPKVSRYAKQRHVSQILTKYLQAGKQNYNIKYSNKKWKITTVDIITQLQNDETIIQTQFRLLCQKYIYQVILLKKVSYQYNDRQIWSEILPNIIQDRWNSSDGGEEYNVHSDEDGKGDRHHQSTDSKLIAVHSNNVNKQGIVQNHLLAPNKHEVIVTPLTNKQIQKYADIGPSQQFQLDPNYQYVTPIRPQIQQEQQNDDDHFQDAVQHQVIGNKEQVNVNQQNQNQFQEDN